MLRAISLGQLRIQEGTLNRGTCREVPLRVWHKLKAAKTLNQVTCRNVPPHVWDKLKAAKTPNQATCRKVLPRVWDKLERARTKTKPILPTLPWPRLVKTGMNGTIANGGHGTSARSCLCLADIITGDSGYWYPALGYDPNYFYDDDGPIYAYGNLLPDRVIANVQTQLQQDGYYFGPITGSLDSATRAAIANYQRDQGLVVTATIDQPTVESLGLA